MSAPNRPQDLGRTAPPAGPARPDGAATRQAGQATGQPSGPRHALVTGAGRGIGAAVVQRLARDGLRLSLMGRSRPALEALAARLPAASAPCVLVGDVTLADDWLRCLAQAQQAHGPVQVLVNNAGAAASAPLARTDDALWQRMLAVNLTGPFLGVRAVLPGMQAARWGRIVNIASTAGQRGYAYVSAYVAAKHGVVGLTRAAALEVALQGITVNAVCPGFTETDLLADSIANVVAKTGRSADAARAEFTRHNPQGRLVQPEEVADAVAWLCSEAAGSVTGQCLSVSGGEVM